MPNTVGKARPRGYVPYWARNMKYKNTPRKCYCGIVRVYLIRAPARSQKGTKGKFKEVIASPYGLSPYVYRLSY